MVDHRQVFHHELEGIEARVIELFGMVAEDVPRATDALLSGNSEDVQRLNRHGLHPWVTAVEHPFWIRVRATSVTGRQTPATGG